LIKYLGSKRRLVVDIMSIIKGLDGVRDIVDLFSGACHVSLAAKKSGYNVTSVDNATYAYVIAKAYMCCDPSMSERVSKEIERLQTMDGVDGYFVDTFCRKSRFFQEKNGMKIQAIRREIDLIDDHFLKMALLTSLMEAADRVDSTVGQQMAYLKSWSARSFNDLEMRVPEFVQYCPGQACSAYLSDAIESSNHLSGDLFYLDPPYNEHRYRAYYHVWETLCRWDNPEHYGVACKRVDLKADPSFFNRKKTCEWAIREVVKNADCKYILASYSNEGHVSKETMMDILSSRGDVTVKEVSIRRNVQGVIGKHSPKGEWKGGEDRSHGEATEYLFLVKCHEGLSLSRLQRERDREARVQAQALQGRVPLQQDQHARLLLRQMQRHGERGRACREGRGRQAHRRDAEVPTLREEGPQELAGQEQDADLLPEQGLRLQLHLRQAGRQVRVRRGACRG